MTTQKKPHKEIASRIRGIREAMGFSLEDLAAKAGVSTENAALFESGDSEIPVGYLYSVANLCGVDLTVLVSGGEARLSEFSLVKKGEGLSVERRKSYDYKNLAYRFAGKRMEPFLITAPPREESEMSYAEHPGQEFIYILKGRLEVRFDHKVVELEPGDSLYFASRTPHALRGLDGKKAVFLDVITA